jgi:hypothetical protein
MYSFDVSLAKLEEIRKSASLMILGKDHKIYFREGTNLMSFTPFGFSIKGICLSAGKILCEDLCLNSVLYPAI